MDKRTAALIVMAALVALSVPATSVSALGTVIDLANFPSPARLEVYGGAAQDQAGSAVAAGDLNGDGVADLVIGARYADPGGRTSAGEVYAIYGGSSASGWVSLDSSFTGVRWQGAAAMDQFGEALATGDFNGDNIDDLAVGASWATPGGRVDAGTVYVFFGQPGPLPSLDLSSQSAPLTLWGAAGDRAGLPWRSATWTGTAGTSSSSVRRAGQRRRPGLRHPRQQHAQRHCRSRRRVRRRAHRGRAGGRRVRRRTGRSRCRCRR